MLYLIPTAERENNTKALLSIKTNNGIPGHLLKAGNRKEYGIKAQPSQILTQLKDLLRMIHSLV